MYERERLLDRIAEHEARVMHGTLDITIEQWALIYDRVEWDYRSTSDAKLADVVRDDDDVDYYDNDVEDDARRTDEWAANDRGRRLPDERESFEVSFA